MTTALTPHQLLADIAALDRQIADWQVDGRLDWNVDQYLKAQRAELLDDLRTRFNTKEFDGVYKENWAAWQGDIDYDHNGFTFVPTMPIAYGKTEIEAIETLLEMIGEDA